MLDILSQEIAATDKVVKDIYDQDPDAKLLATIPGIGGTIATLLSIEIDGIEHFSSPSKLCSYAGLVPSTHSSRGKTYHGEITSEGNRWIRWAMVEVSIPASFGHAEIRNRLESLRDRKSANVAKTAMARWLLKVVYHVLKEKRPYVADYSKAVAHGAAF